MRDLQGTIYNLVLVNGHMSYTEIQNSLLDVNEKTVQRAIKTLVKNEKLDHKVIFGSGSKRKRYSLTEKPHKNDITIRVFKEEDYKNRELSTDELLSRETHETITQKDLAHVIKEYRKSYRQEMNKMKQYGETREYYLYHTSMISYCLGQITKLTMAINSSMFYHDPNKLDHARLNRVGLEEFLGFICDNIKQYDEKRGNAIIRRLTEELDDVWLFQEIKF